MRARALATVVAAAVLAACGGGDGPVAGPTPTPCPASNVLPDPGGGTTLRGFVLEGRGTDGAFSGRPLACARVVVVTRSGSVELSTDSRGFFDVGSTPTEFALHVYPPPTTQAASVSVLDARTAATGQVVRLYLPLNRPAGSPSRDPGGSPTPAVRGRLVDPDGRPQVGSYPAGGVPGDPGSTGFVWWGAPPASASGNWVDAGITDSSGRFTVWARLGGQRLGLTRPLFAGNYDGSREGRDVLHYTSYVYLPAVDVLAGSTTDVGTLTVRPPEAELRVVYDAAAREVLAGWGPTGIGFTYLLSRPSVTAGLLEFGRAFTGPHRGGIATEQRVPAPQPLVSGAPGTFVVARSYAYDAAVTDGTGELSLTEVVASGSPPSVTVTYLAPTRNFAWNGQSRTFSWASLLLAGGYELWLHDSDNRVVWVGVRGSLQNSVVVPFPLARGGYYAYVRATDVDAPREWLSGQLLGPRPLATRAPARRMSADAESPTPLRRESYSRTLVFSVP